jgi:hypothetical protein
MVSVAQSQFQRAVLALFVLTLIGANGAPAWGGEREDAELLRLMEDMGSMAEQSHWSGVERTYERMLALEDVNVPYDAHYAAAQAARNSGNMSLVLVRLERAASIKRPPGLSGWLEEIEGDYGRVEVNCTGRRHPELKPATKQMHPDKRRQVALAKAAIDENCAYKGLLPAGFYTLGTRTLEVVPGMTMRLDMGGK